MRSPTSSPPRTLAAIAAACGGTLLGTDGPASPAASIDSRAVHPGGLFCALKGENTDGHAYVAAALAAGAAAALVSDPESVGQARPLIVVEDVAAAMGRLAATHVAALRTGHLTVLAVTGSAGKTTTKDLMAGALPGPTVANEKSLNNEIGLPLTALRATEETRYLVLEMGADKAGDIDYLTSLVAPDVAVVLFVGRAHLGGFGSRDAVARAKSELVRGLAPGGVAVLNADDARVLAMSELASGRVVTFGRGEGAEVRATDVELDAADHATFTVEAGESSARLTLGLSGEHNVSNALAALAAAHAVGADLGQAAARLDGRGPASPHRMDISERDGLTVIDDAYNANPDSVAAALAALVRIAAGRRTVAVLGEMRELGEVSRAEHVAVGERARELGVDELVVMGEGAEPIARAFSGARYAADLDGVRAELDDLAAPGDVVLFKASNGTGLWRLAEGWRT